MIKRQSTILTLNLLEQISCSVSSFKPSSSLAELALLQKEKMKSEENPIAEIDVVISGGGMKGYFMVGAVYILAKEMIKNNVKIARCSGTSAGSWGGMFLLLYIYAGFDNYFWLETYHQAHEQLGVPLLDVFEKYFVEVLRDNPNLFPPNAYKICSGRLFISITVLTKWGPKLKIISEFESNDDLVACCCASSAIPYLTQSTALRIYRGEYVCDGGIFNNTPVFPDGIRRQLVFRLTDVEYPFRMMTNPLDTCIDTLVLRGALIMQRFLQGEPADSIAWLDIKKSKTDLVYKPNRIFRRLLVPFTLAGIVLFNGHGALSPLAKVLESVGITPHLLTTVIPFQDAGTILRESSLGYVVQTLFASLVNALRSFNLLL